MKKILGLVFLVAWVAGEVPRLWWKETVLVRPMDAAAGLLFLAEIIGNKNYKIIGLIILAAILGPYAARTLVYGWLIWRGREIFGGVRKWIMPAWRAFLILGLGQYVFFPDTRFLLQYGWDEHYYRLVGTVLDPNYFGVMAGMILLISLRYLGVFSWPIGRADPRYHFLDTLGQEPSLISSSPLGQEESKILLGSSSVVSKMTSSDQPHESLWANVILTILSFVVLILTFSRASWLAFGLGFWIWFGPGTMLTCSRGLRPRVARARVRGSGVPADFSDEKSGYIRRRLGILGILGILGVGVWWAAPKPGGEGVNLMRTSSIEQRLVSWNQAIEVWKQHPWVGRGSWGYGVWSKKATLPSSSWLVILETTGILGVIVIGSLAISYWRRMDIFWKGIAIMVGFHAIFNNTLFYPPVLGLVAMMRAVDDI